MANSSQQEMEMANKHKKMFLLTNKKTNFTYQSGKNIQDSGLVGVEANRHSTDGSCKLVPSFWCFLNT